MESVNWWNGGWAECARKGQRLIERARLWMLRRDLKNAEVELGMMGWQQADFFAPEEQEQIGRITQLEKEEASGFNREAELNENLRALEQQEVQARQNAEGELLRAMSALDAAEVSAENAKAELERKRGDVARFNSAIAELEKQISNLERVAARLLAVDTPEATTERSRIPQTRIKLEEELDALRKLSSVRGYELTRAQDEVTRYGAEVSTIRAELREIAKAAANEERAISAEKAAIAEKRKQTKKHFATLEQGKREPLRVIGRRLADCGIAPLNQPEVLERVLAIRAKIAELSDSMADSFAQSAGMNPQIMRHFYVVMGVIVSAIALILIAVLR